MSERVRAADAGPADAAKTLRRAAAAIGNRALARVATNADPFAGARVPTDVADGIAGRLGRGTPVDASVAERVGDLTGVDVGHAQVHTDAEADRLSRSVAAEAFTVGADVFFRSGRYSPQSSAGRELVAHELTHVAQNAAGTATDDGRISDPADATERQARAVASQTDSASLTHTESFYTPSHERQASRSTAIHRDKAVEPPTTGEPALPQASPADAARIRALLATTGVNVAIHLPTDLEFMPAANKRENEFERQSLAWSKNHEGVGLAGGRLVLGRSTPLINGQIGQTISRILDALVPHRPPGATSTPLNRVAIFTHGLSDSIRVGGTSTARVPKPGYKGPEQQSGVWNGVPAAGGRPNELTRFLDQLAANLVDGGDLIFYACSTAGPAQPVMPKDYESFVKDAYDYIQKRHTGELTVWGHNSAAHQTNNPDTMAFTSGGPQALYSALAARSFTDPTVVGEVMGGEPSAQSRSKAWTFWQEFFGPRGPLSGGRGARFNEIAVLVELAPMIGFDDFYDLVVGRVEHDAITKRFPEFRDVERDQLGRGVARTRSHYASKLPELQAITGYTEPKAQPREPRNSTARNGPLGHGHTVRLINGTTAEMLAELERLERELAQLAQTEHPAFDAGKYVASIALLRRKIAERGNSTLADAPFELRFNGRYLSATGGASFSAPAVSGEKYDGEFVYSVARQKLADTGPIPAGTYWLDPQELAVVMRPWLMPGWGLHRITIHPFDSTNTYGRGLFAIHGGVEPGSAGCIDLGGNMSAFATFLESAQTRPQKIKLRVDYGTPVPATGGKSARSPFHMRAEEGNRTYAAKPPRKGWPYDSGWTAMWAANEVDEMADAVRAHQLNVMKVSPSKADGIIGPATAKSIHPAPTGGTPDKRLDALMASEGELLRAYATESGIDMDMLLGLLLKESEGGMGTGERMIIRFEVHKFYDWWGETHQATFDQHFRYTKGKHSDQDFRRSATDGWTSVHSSQTTERQALAIARVMDNEIALQALGMGLGQLMGRHFRGYGFDNAQEMFDSLSTTVRAQMTGFLTFIRTKELKKLGKLSDALKRRDTFRVASLYNGVGREETYAPRLERCIAEANAYLARQGAVDD